MANKQIPTEGEFFISVGGNRLKQHPGNTVYLGNGNEFQLEIFNPTTSKVLAKIKINGNYISNTGLVLKPGQRVFLERYLDEAKKFKFETYNVDSTPETQAAIANNGTVEVEFYKEYVSPAPVYIPTYNPPIWTNNIFYSTGTVSGGLASYSTTTNGSGSLNAVVSSSGNLAGNVSYTSSVNQASFNASNDASALGGQPKSDASMFSRKLSKESTKNEATYDSMSFASLEFERSFSAPEQKETGRVEGGSHSNQTFSTDYATYNSWVSNKVTWKILPLSQKPLEVSEIRNYCSSCGARVKKSSWSFCPQCGNKF